MPIDPYLGFSVASQINAVVGITDSPLLPRDEHRIALVVCAPPTNRITLSLDNPAVLDVGITLYPAGAPLVLTIAQVGRLIRGPIRAISAVGAQNISVWSVSSFAP